MRIILFLTTLFVSSVGFAQDLRQVECRFLSFGSKEDAPSVITLGAKGAEIMCPLSSSELSDKIVCFASGDKISFISAADKKPVATATIPAGVRSALLVFVRPGGGDKKAAGDSNWRIFVIDDSTKNFPDGGAYIANFFSNDIRFIIGEHKGMLRAAGSHGYEMPKERDAFNMAAVTFQFRNGENWRTGSESSFRFLPGMRYLFIAYVDPSSGYPRVNTYQDLAKPTPADAPAP